MPTLRTDAAPPPLVARVKAFARDRALTVSAAVLELVTRGLASTDAKSAGGAKGRAGLTAEQRSAAARRAAAARWQPPTDD